MFCPEHVNAPVFSPDLSGDASVKRVTGLSIPSKTQVVSLSILTTLLRGITVLVDRCVEILR